MEKILPYKHMYHEFLDRLLFRLDYIRLQPKNILIVDIFFDYTKNFLSKKYPDAKIFSASNEINAAEYQNNFFDLILSSFSLLREEKPAALLKTIYRLLCDEGLLLCMTLGPDTFFELRKSFSTVDSHEHIYPFMDMHYLGDGLKKLRLADPVVDREEITILYDDLNLFFQDLKSVDSKNCDEKHFCGLCTKNKWQKMLAEYAKHKMDNHFPVTIELIYATAWKIKLPQQYDEEKNEVMISIDKIRRSTDS